MVALVSLSACADGGAQAEQPATTPTVAASTSAASTAPTTTTVAPGPILTAEDLLALVSTSYAAVYAGGAYDPGFVENGEAHADTLDAFRANPRTAELQVAVTAAAYLDDTACVAVGVSAPCIETRWDLRIDGALAVPDNTGYLVWSDGRWKVSELTFCSLAILSDPTISDC